MNFYSKKNLHSGIGDTLKPIALILEKEAHLTLYFRNKSYCFFQVRILKDISESLNFTYKIRPPTDGNKWGLIYPNGSATGLVKDVKVFLNTVYC